MGAQKSVEGMDDLVLVSDLAAVICLQAGLEAERDGLSTEVKVPRWAAITARVLLSGVHFMDGEPTTALALMQKVQRDPLLKRFLVGGCTVNASNLDLYFALRDWDSDREPGDAPSV